MIKLVASRLEELLTSQEKSLDLSALQKRLNLMQQHGARLVLMTKASYPDLLRRFQTVNGPLDYVAENGAEVVINGVNVKETLLNAVLLSQILEWLGQKPEFHPAMVTLSSKMNTITNAKPSNPLYPVLHRAYPTAKFVPDLLMIARQVYQIRIDLPGKDVKQFREMVRAHFGHQIRVVNGGKHYFYLLAPDATWAHGLAVIQKHFGDRIRQTAAFGKLAVDYGYLNEAKYRFVTTDAADDVKDFCQSLTGNGQLAVMKRIDQLMKQK